MKENNGILSEEEDLMTYSLDTHFCHLNRAPGMTWYNIQARKKLGGIALFLQLTEKET